MKKNIAIFLFITILLKAQSPIISITPESITQTLFTSKTSQQKITISNNGNADLVYRISAIHPSGEGVKNYSLKFDGVNDYLSCTVNNMFNIKSELTLGVWIKIDSMPGYSMTILNMGDQGYFFLDENSHLSFTQSGISPNNILISALFCVELQETKLKFEKNFRTRPSNRLEAWGFTCLISGAGN